MENPYAPPKADPEVLHLVPGPMQLASLGDRFLGALIDGGIGIAIFLVQLPFLYFAGILTSLEQFGNLGLWEDAVLSLVYFVIYVAIQWRFWKKTGQSIGKRFARTRIATLDGRKPDMSVIARREGFVFLLSLIPLYGAYLAIVEILFVFRKDRRCIHDFIGGTQVVKFMPGEAIPTSGPMEG